MARKRQISVTLPATIVDAIETECKKTGLSISSTINLRLKGFRVVRMKKKEGDENGKEIVGYEP